MFFFVCFFLEKGGGRRRESNVALGAIRFPELGFFFCALQIIQFLSVASAWLEVTTISSPRGTLIQWKQTKVFEYLYKIQHYGRNLFKGTTKIIQHLPKYLFRCTTWLCLCVFEGRLPSAFVVIALIIHPKKKY